MSEIKGKVIAITGASSGIGEATALLLAKKGAQVVLGARRTDRLEALASIIRAEGGSAKYRTLDVTKLEDVEAFINFALAEFGKLDVIINNAGIMPISPIEALKVNEWNQMIDVNMRGVMHGIAAGLPVMKKQGFGQFINVSSTAGHAVHPTGGIYSGTKFAVMAISEGLRQENANIRVTVISPGLTKSELDNTISGSHFSRSLSGIPQDRDRSRRNC